PMPRKSINDRVSLLNVARTGQLNAQWLHQTPPASSPEQPRVSSPSHKVAMLGSSTWTTTTRNKGPAWSNGTLSARRRNEVGRPMFYLTYDIQMSMPRQRTSAQVAMRHSSTSS
ncbi:hypothetical protein EV121DRAFT_168635, partial [Schizophyllum commune]